MDRVFIVTGACGHLGNNIIRKLIEKGEKVRGLILPKENILALKGLDIEIQKGNVCDIASLETLFTFDKVYEIIVIHTAGIVSISSKYLQNVYDVNVTGTANIVKMCLKYKVKRLIHISSVHAIPEKANRALISEASIFHSDNVVGLYAKTKAEATAIVLNSVNEGLDAIVIQPSGIIGPYDYGRGHTTQLIADYLEGRLTASIKGGYDFVDVRDVADGVIASVEKGRSGECYILSNKYITVEDLLNLLSEISGNRRIKTILPLLFARITAPLSELYYKLLRQPPLYTRYSLYTLSSNSHFSHEKACKELGYAPRDIKKTLQDTIDYLVKNERVNKYIPK